MKNNSGLFFISAILLGLLIGIYLPSKKNNTNLSAGSSSEKVQTLFNLIEAKYVDTVNMQHLTDITIENALKQLDPHSAYIPASDLANENEVLQGNFEGIGIQFRMEKDTVYVVMPIQGGPSQKAGLLAGDRIIKINDSIVAGKNIPDKNIIKKLKGKKGSRVHVSIKRSGITKLLEFDIVRDVIPSYSVDYSGMLDKNIGYIKISKFSATTYDEYMAAFNKLKKQGLTSLILDLRGNGGGYLDQAIALADEFLPNKELIVYTEGNSQKRADAFASKNGAFEKGKLIVLIDEFSASASEIVAGAIQDNDRGTIVGRRSFGKGLVQEQFELTDGSAIRLTIARYHTPSGRCIQRPYEKGTDEYYESYLERILSGNDSIGKTTNAKDSIPYKTKKGRIVFGGGGIMPDVDLAHKRDTLAIYYNELMRKGLLYKFCFEYADNNRAKLLKYKTVEEFLANFKDFDILFEKFVKDADTAGIKRNNKSLDKYGTELKTLMKAYIAENIFGDDAFYKIYLSADEDLQKAIQIMKKSS